MKNFNKISQLSLLALILACLLPAFCGSAAADTWHLRAGGVWIDPDGTVERSIDGVEVRSEAGDDVGLGATLEYRPGPRWGLEFGAPIIGDPDLGVRLSDGDQTVQVDDTLGMIALTAGVNVHLTPHRKIDLYAGPFVGLVLLEDLAFLIEEDRVRLSVSDEFAYGAVVGVDVPLSESWGLNATARYLAFHVDALDEDRDSTRIDFDTLALGAGFRFSF